MKKNFKILRILTVFLILGVFIICSVLVRYSGKQHTEPSKLEASEKSSSEKWNEAQVNQVLGGDPPEEVYNHYTQDVGNSEVKLYAFLEKYYNGDVTIDKSNIEGDIETLSKEFYNFSKSNSMKKYHLTYKFATYSNEVRLFVMLSNDGNRVDDIRYTDTIQLKYK